MKLASIVGIVVVATVVVALLVPYNNNEAHWISFGFLMLSELAFLIPIFLKQSSDFNMRIPAYIALIVNFGIQMPLSIAANFVEWRVILIPEIILLSAAAILAIVVSLHEESQDKQNADLESKIKDVWNNEKRGSF